jgi:putative membrane protein
MQLINWEYPQRQPIAGLFIVFIKTAVEILKRAWPFVLLFLFRNKPEENTGIDKYEWLAILFAISTFFSGVMKYLYFRFHIINNELIVKKGWLKKQTIVVPLQNIQTVQIDASFLHQALNVVQLSVDTAGSNKVEVKIDALKKEMAEALRHQLQQTPIYDQVEDEKNISTPIIKLTEKDLLKLSLSANHLEALLLFLSFGFGIYDNLRNINADFIPSTNLVLPKGVVLMLFMTGAILLVTIAISTARIFLKFYGFTVYSIAKGFHITSGLTNKKEYLVNFKKIQAVSWKANWIRRCFNLWMLEYRIAGADELKSKMRVQIPVTNTDYLPKLVDAYYPAPNTSGASTIHIHPSYILLRTTVFLLISLVAVIITWYWWDLQSLFFLLLPAYIALVTYLRQRKFRLWAMHDVLCMKKGLLGIEMVLLKWIKMQSLQIKQSTFQRKRGLATLIIHTASDKFVLPFIPLNAAQEIINYGLYQVESSKETWM